MRGVQLVSRACRGCVCGKEHDEASASGRVIADDVMFDICAVKPKWDGRACPVDLNAGIAGIGGHMPVGVPRVAYRENYNEGDEESVG